MGTKTAGSSTPPPDTTHNVSTSTNAQWRSDTTITMPENGYVDSVRVYCGASSGGSSTFKGALWNTNNSLRSSSNSFTYGTGFGFNIFGWPTTGLHFISSGTAFHGGFQASNQGSQLGLLHDAGSYWLQQSINAPTTFGGSKDTFGQFGGMAWFITYYPTATISSFSPTVGGAGTTVTLTGQSYSAGVTGVSFNGTAASSFNYINDTTVTAVVPAGATSGTVTITTNAGNATSSGSFTVAGAYVMRSGVWTPTQGVFVMRSGTWTQVTGVFVMRSGTWTPTG